MKKLWILILLGIILNPILAFSQDYETRGNDYYNSGKYSDAVNQYKAALAYLKSRKISTSDRKYSEIERQLARAEKCVPLMSVAENLFNKAESSEDYTAARNAYQRILEINMSDSYSKNQINMCDTQIMQITMRKADNEMWAKITQGNPGKAQYQQYITEFPNGLHANDAKFALQEIEDGELWTLAKNVNTKEAYESYLANELTSIHNSEAQMAIYKIEDDAMWAIVLQADTEEEYNKYVADASNPAKSHQAEAVAKLSVIKTKKIIESISTSEESKAKAGDIVKTLETASKTITLSEEDAKLLTYYKSINDYEAFYKSPNLADGLKYLKTYPDSEYAEWVSNKVSEFYANNLDAESTENDYQLARSYARSIVAQKYVDNKISSAKKSAKLIQRRGAWSDRFQLGIGVDAEMLNNIALGPRLEFKIGAGDDFFNFSLGAKALWWKPEWLNAEIQHINFIQVPIYAAAKMNLFRIGRKTRFYIGGEGAYNLNMDSKIYVGSGDYEKDLSLVNKYNMSATARIGFCSKHGDFSIYYRHDLSPAYNQQYIYEMYNSCYNEFEKILNERFRIGVSYTCYIIF